MNGCKRKKLSTTEKIARGIYYGLMIIMIIIVAIGVGVMIADQNANNNAIDAYANNSVNEIKSETSSHTRSVISPEINDTVIETRLSVEPTITPLPTCTPLPTPSPTPTPGNYWGCEHECDEEGRYYNISLDSEYQVYLHDICEEIGVPFELAIATCWAESRYSVSDYNINTDGSVDAGLFQINECNWEWFQEIFGELWDPYDPYDSIDAGLYYIQYCMEYDDDPRVYMMVYNMGPSGARKCWDNGTWSTKYSRALYKYMTEELPTLKIIKD